jgi:hypothetical protein
MSTGSLSAREMRHRILAGLWFLVRHPLRRARLKRALCALPPIERRCLELRADGQTLRAIASSIGLEVSVTAALIARGIEHLQRDPRISPYGRDIVRR